ncbi:glycosyltransferase family protein [Tenacibaculum sp. IB213877]|uniref:glycosyltransferase family protein n=1 Tax=Tenacibaculum sp. IB213877 TaxID=3097351 RepID=UPI002A5AEEB5|nr:glycosyltransferase family protein [Tenacibaculum sp. IB213877]MDY0779175.1 glycosyltransferase family protein [Tenacibaculum sp. IB213877]
MKILYAIQGTGNGHSSRAIEIVPHLQKRAEVDVLISGYQCELQLPFDVKYKLYGLSFIFGKKGGIDLWKTLRKTKIKNLLKEIKSLPVKDYDLVINDFEPVSAWACKLKNVPLISLSHQNAVADDNAPKYGTFKLEKLLLKYYAPAKNKFGFHFKTYSSATFLPIIRKEIRHRNITNKGHYTVYLPAYGDKKLLKLLSTFKDVKWEIFSKHTQQFELHNNITIRPIDGKDFIKSIASSNGVLCGAGFETPAEALYLRKKLMVIPMKNQYEQQCNALALKEMGVPVLKKLNKKQLSKIEKWLKSKETVKVQYPDVTEDILDALILPYYNESILPEITIG